MSYYWLFAGVTVVELCLFVMIWSFFRRLRQSENLLAELQNSQSALLEKIELNASLEKELLQSFQQRQNSLLQLDARLEEKAARLQSLLAQAEQVSRSPGFLRELILNGSRKGLSLPQLAKETGLSLDEVELILARQD